MTKEEVLEYLNSELRHHYPKAGYHEKISIDAIHSCADKPDKDIPCFVVRKDKYGAYLGSYENGHFGYYQVHYGTFDEFQTPVDDAEWYIPFSEVEEVMDE